MSIYELDSKVNEMKALQEQIDRLEAEVEAIKDMLKQKMIDEGSDTITGNGWKASWKAVTSSKFDSKTFKAQHSDLYAAFCKPSTVCRFVLN